MFRMEELRKDKGWTKTELSKRANMPISTVNFLENGYVKDPRLSTLLKLSRALGCTIDDLVGKEDEPQ